MSIRGSQHRALLLALCLAPASVAFAAIHHPGKWTNPILSQRGASPGDVFHESAVNMALLALPDSAGRTQARVLWFQDDHEHVPGQHVPFGGYWEWRAPGDSLLNAGSFPDTSGVTGTLRARRYPSPEYNIFCSGMAQMEEDQGYGRLLVAGGTLEAENGSTEARIYNARTNSWETTANSLAVGRWYPTLTTLPTGQTLVTSGSRFRELWLVGGADADSLVHRDPVSHGTSWLSSVLPEQSAQLVPPRRMGPRRGHTATWSLGGSQIIFGGLDLNSGAPVDQFWQLGIDGNASGSDYTFRWQRRTPLAAGPSARAFHAAAVIPKASSPLLDNSLVLVGGDTTGTGVASRTVWLGTLVGGTWSVDWEDLAPTFDSDPFPARFGHTAYWHDDSLRLFVYGGTSALNAAPSDPNVYSFEFIDNGSSDSVRIKRCALQDGIAPMPRAYFAAGVVEREIPDDLQNPTGNVPARGLFVYGGRTGTGAADVSDSLYVLWPLDRETVRWQRVPQSAAPGGARPPALEFASGTGTTNSIEFWLAGGRDASGTARSEVYSFQAHCQPCDPASLMAEWETRPSAGHAVWGHTMPVRTNETFARTPEIFEPASKAFTHYPGAYRLQDWYPHTFILPGSGTGTAIATGPSIETWKFQASTASWTQVASATSGFRGGAAVSYAPGRVMKCGSRDTDTGDPTAIGTTTTLDLGQATPAWMASDTMVGRVNHNLTLLPDGKVLVSGGMGVRDNQQNLSPRRRPELWDPAGNGGAGVWEGGDGVGIQLDTSQVARNYHSTALLLPDGRVLCAGGNATNRPGDDFQDDQFRVDIYSPPYLFNADGTGAIRPDLRTAPRRVSYGQPFVVSVGGGDAIAGGCLIRAGAATHGYDQSQLYIPLSFTQVGPIGTSTRYYRTAAPTDSAVAPPGDYLLFVRNGQGTPSIARWVNVSRTNGSLGVPTTVTDLGRECIDGTAVRLRWTPPGSDVGDTVLVKVRDYQVRYATVPMNSPYDFITLGTALTPPSFPGEPLGDPDRLDTPALTAGQTYYFRMRARNYSSWNGNWSELSNQFVWTVHDEECGGSGGGGGGGGYEEGASIRPGGAAAASSFPRGGSVAALDSTYLENTLLPNSPVGVTRRDRVHLPYGPRWSESGAAVRLNRTGTRATQFDRVRLLAVDYAAGEGAFVRGGELVGGVTHDPDRVQHADGRDLTELFVAGGGFEGHDGDTLYADLGADGAGSLMLASSRAQLVRAPDRTGIEVACETAAGWAAAGHHEVREHSSEEVFDVPALRRVRLVFRGRHRLEGVMRFTTGSPLVVTAYEPGSAEHSRLGDVVAGLAAGEGAAISPGEQLLVGFAATPAAEGASRAWFLEVEGAHLATAGGAQGARLSGTSGTAPAAFALARNRPNPFTSSTTFLFDVPRRAHVRLDVFDVLGRRVATLENREYRPGRFTLDWDGRTSAGVAAPAGVYLCRMSAGPFREELHVVLVR